MPFDGMLYTVDRAISVSKKAERCEFVVKETEQTGKKQVDFEKTLCKELRKVDKDAFKLKQEILTKQPIPIWAPIVSFASGVAFTILSVWAADKVTN